jgi:hypothetical protein
MDDATLSTARREVFLGFLIFISRFSPHNGKTRTQGVERPTVFMRRVGGWGSVVLHFLGKY